MKEFFLELSEYTHYYNQKLFDLFEKNETALSGKALQLLSHTLNAHHVWNARINERVNSYGIWQLHNLKTCRNIEEENYSSTITIIKNKELEQIINYKNSSGDKYGNTIKDILFHVINHSTYHRAQIATEFRNAGVEPLVSDYIFYKRTL